jgi:hypothetical protein
VNRIAIAVPARDTVMTHFAFSYANMLATHASKEPGDLIPLLSQGTMIQSQRTELVKQAQSADATHILFLDSDMTFPEDTISRLLSHDLDVVGANCAKRRTPTGPTATDIVDGKPVEVYSMPESAGLQQIQSLGAALMLVKMGVFSVIPAPWFATPWVKYSSQFMGEDAFFCAKLREAGIPLFIDHDLSKMVGHIGTFEYRHEHTYAFRREERPLIEVAR